MIEKNDSYIIFGLIGSSEEHLGLIEKEDQDEITIKDPRTIAKSISPTGNMAYGLVPFMLSVNQGMSKVNLFKSSISWYSSEIEENLITRYKSDISGIVIPNQSQQKKLTIAK